MKQTKRQGLVRRKIRVRSRISGTASRPRLVVSKSLRGLFVQLIDDEASKTLVSVNSKTVDPKGDAGGRIAKVAAAFILGKAIADKAKAAGITAVVFDRSGHRYHGRVQAVADGARDGGLEF